MKTITGVLLLLVSLTACSQNSKSNNQASNLIEAEARKAIELDPNNAQAQTNLRKLLAGKK